MEKFFHLKENGTTVSTEILAGLTTFFAMAYIIVVNPQILSQTGMPWGGVFLATIIAAIIGTLVMGLFANVPYAQAAGMGLNAFFTYTVCFGLGFSWQQTMCMVFLCGLINILITVTKIRKMIILAIPESLQHAIGAICGTSNTTTYVESSAGIAAGGRTGLTSVVVAICFALSAFLAPVVSAVPSAATAGVLVIVGCMMAASLKEVKWDDIAEAIPAFFAAVFMAFSYSISYGIAGGFIMYCIVKTCKGKAKEVHPIIWTVAALFILDFVCMAIL